MTARPDLGLLRLVAQRLAGPRLGDAVEVVRHLGAVQAQDLPGALSSVALRFTGGSRAGVEVALISGHVVRSWPMRGTLHLVPAEDLGWILSLTATRMLSAADKRRTDLGITEATIERASDIALAALADGEQLTRKELFAHWAAEGLLRHPQTGIHLLGRLCQEATLVLGPTRGNEQLVASYADWVPSPRALARDEALAELARRFLHSHGPATVADLARWASLTLTDSRAGIASIRGELTSIKLDGTEYLMDPALPDLLAQHRRDALRLRLLPGFDEYLLGYADRSFAVPASFADQIVPGNNGMFRPTIVKAGRVIGTWKRGGATAKPRVEAQPFAELSRADQAGIERAFAELG
jgi:hypothetical protein